VSVDGQWILRPFVPAADHRAVTYLWQLALPPAWPLLPEAVALLEDGFVAQEATGSPIGIVGVDPAGSILLLLVAPAHQRRGVGTALVEAALRRLGSLGVRAVGVGSGGRNYIWPGVPEDLPAAARFFAARGWPAGPPTLDLALDLHGYRPPAGVYERAARAGATLALVTSQEDFTGVLAFETEVFPSWVWWFRRRDRDILTARNADGSLIGALLFQGPGAASVYTPLLGSHAGVIGCVGVAPAARALGVGSALVAHASERLRDTGTHICHISWTARECFYIRLGYQPWRRYRMFRRVIG
jgi:beta-N-acetylhexosaminidase